jgi:hypothetical protein
VELRFLTLANYNTYSIKINLFLPKFDRERVIVYHLVSEVLYTNLPKAGKMDLLSELLSKSPPVEVKPEPGAGGS